jgi:hypothetical protein
MGAPQLVLSAAAVGSTRKRQASEAAHGCAKAPVFLLGYLAAFVPIVRYALPRDLTCVTNPRHPLR